MQFVIFFQMITYHPAIFCWNRKIFLKAQTTEGGNSSEPADDEANFDEQLAHPIPDEDEEEIPEETSEEVSEQPLDLKKSNSFLN